VKNKKRFDRGERNNLINLKEEFLATVPIAIGFPDLAAVATHSLHRAKRSVYLWKFYLTFINLIFLPLSKISIPVFCASTINFAPSLQKMIHE
jgi:hypothetical protein